MVFFKVCRGQFLGGLDPNIPTHLPMPFSDGTVEFTLHPLIDLGVEPFGGWFHKEKWGQQRIVDGALEQVLFE